jgi:hypothetical protein
MKNKICIYCFSLATTKDHLFPKSWYPDDTTTDVQRLTVPACAPCNQKFARVEEELFLRLGIALDSSNKGAKGLSSKARNRIDFENEPNTILKKVKEKAFLAVINDLRRFDPKTTLSGLGPLAGVRSSLGIPLGNQRLITLGEKIGRGLEFKLRGQILYPPRKVEVYPVHMTDTLDPYYKKWNELLKKQKKSMNMGSAFMVEWGVDPQNNETSLYRVRMWNHIDFWIWCVTRMQ